MPLHTAYLLLPIWANLRLLRQIMAQHISVKNFYPFVHSMKFPIKQAFHITQWVKQLQKEPIRPSRNIFKKLKGGSSYSPSTTQLSTILFILNFLTVDAEGCSPMEHHTQIRAQSLGWVSWKDLQTGRWMEQPPCWQR